MYSRELIKQLLAECPGTEEIPVPDKFVRDPEPQLRVAPERLKDVCRYLKDNPHCRFDLPVQITAVDYIKDDVFEVVYTFYSTQRKEGLIFKARLDRSRPEIDSVSDIWPGANFQEREAYDLMGIQFKGHPNLKRIMMWDGFPGHPLRKDYMHQTDRFDSGLEVGTPGLDAKGIPHPGRKS